MERKRIKLDDIPDEIETLVQDQFNLIACDLTEIKKLCESCGFSTNPDDNTAIMIRAKGIERNASTLALMLRNPRGYLENVICREII